MPQHPGMCTCLDCIERRDRIRTRSLGQGQRIGWNAHSLDSPRERVWLTNFGTKPRYLRGALDDYGAMP